jgi:hypothetical protein
MTVGLNIWNFILDLLNCSHVAIKVRAIHFLGLSLSGNNGEIDPRQVIQFEKVQGFMALAAKFANFSGDSDAITEALLSLFFWRRLVRTGGDESRLPDQTPRFNKLDVIDEVFIFATFYSLI